MTNEKKRPVFERRLGNIRVTVWKNVSEGKEGGEARRWFNASISRRYKDGDDWKEASTFNGVTDMALVQHAVVSAIQWMEEAERLHVSNQEADGE